MYSPARVVTHKFSVGSLQRIKSITSFFPPYFTDITLVSTQESASSPRAVIFFKPTSNLGNYYL